MIINMKPLNLIEVKELVKDLDEKKELKEYLKKFVKLSKDKSDKLAEELRELGNVKIKEEYLVKIIEFLPKDTVDLNKIFHDISLDEKETNEILEIVKKY
ncbi:MAG: hypothetical protein IIA87_00130 [Nanoarchaeota archaeon]|nr:hypothetical protein [Nanoarchaeota archaeon]